ncbi:hypothetical protein SODALDRAFT_283307 [Sodiomyces alkalinus F11]|uniref:Uncharacterized protein n=1 Tax=Sodiomyces alkalinus (strain CBS 110278 / VKM F-3762 / F11) TaxID=1314773 RepID=A0A3N2PMT3_SODAK|nr:hypothetical protein SODALDRAFT_283307 [Sodiomyces alkalinus F11]ROT35740.1 hypothetical protein SODALDRAFT_283307 [Sodiomyces alkalinus F11]
MPKRSIDASSVSDEIAPDRATQRKTERSHEENQERAYIAASRRADRSIEARVKSAQMASDIHKRRTGKGFKISEQIVRAEEMYEEEDDDMPRSYRMLASHLQTNSPELNYRVNAFIANRVALASMVAGLRNEDWQQNPINKMFAEQFPNADKHAQAMNRNLAANSAYYGPVVGHGSPPPQREGSASSPMSPSFGPANYHPRGHPSHERSHSRELSDRRDSGMSPLSMAHGSVAPFSPPQSVPAYPQDVLDQSYLPVEMHPDNSCFTAELSQEVKMMAGPGMDMNDPLAPILMGGEPIPPYYTDSHGFSVKSEMPVEPRVPMSQDYPNFGMHETAPDCLNNMGSSGPSDAWDSCINWDCDPTQATR